MANNRDDSLERMSATNDDMASASFGVSGMPKPAGAKVNITPTNVLDPYHQSATSLGFEKLQKSITLTPIGGYDVQNTNTNQATSVNSRLADTMNTPGEKVIYQNDAQDYQITHRNEMHQPVARNRTFTSKVTPESQFFKQNSRINGRSNSQLRSSSIYKKSSSNIYSTPRSNKVNPASDRYDGSAFGLNKTAEPLNGGNSPSPIKGLPRVRDGEPFAARMEIQAEKFHDWFIQLDEEAQNVLIWQEKRYERDQEFKETFDLDITDCFDAVNFKGNGLLNNIQFFVMWRALEDKWSRQGLVTRDLPDREMAFLFDIFEDYNMDSEGVTLDDFIECRTLLYKKVRSKRHLYQTSASKTTSLYLNDFVDQN